MPGPLRNTAATLLAAALSVAPLAAEEPAPPTGEGMSDGMALMQEGAQLLLRGLMGELAPLMQDLQGMIDDMALYHAPEVLPNGDILIRRRSPQRDQPPEAAPEGGDAPVEDALEL